ncbi:MULTISPECIES: hypothetical protein [unclassified Kitasatospora]|uniref:hypothetical protein n=1 Tax=unclassified Kitasatospora TaxID=2633591 RepID=UPI00070DD84B|nr:MULTISPECIES: hypothetical protein [unclassified Kitasatospora]KQV13476.1 hypothetical protein ASC99_33830 [Kitasatospora sp. Root107]KRB69786.1 hypothetical protein ASE03_26535 [Kitasatospora sp. Root187]
MYQGLIATLETWHAAGTLPEDSLLLTESLATELVAYLRQHLDQQQFNRWLLDQGDLVCHAQKHPHPAGPTAMEILSIIATDDVQARPDRRAGAERLLRIAVPHLNYLRPGSKVEDAREVALTLAMWAGQRLAELMAHETGRISGYTADRTGS